MTFFFSFFSVLVWCSFELREVGGEGEYRYEGGELCLAAPESDLKRPDFVGIASQTSCA